MPDRQLTYYELIEQSYTLELTLHRVTRPTVGHRSLTAYVVQRYTPDPNGSPILYTTLHLAELGAFLAGYAAAQATK